MTVKTYVDATLYIGGVPAGTATVRSITSQDGPITNRQRNDEGLTGLSLIFVVEGDPVPKKRPRTFARRRRDGSSFVTTTTPPETRAYEDRFRMLAQVAVNKAKWSWAKSDRFHVVMRVFRKYADKGGDLDNICKSGIDSMIGVAIPDDRYVRAIDAKLFHDPKRPRVEVEVRRVSA